VIPQQDVFAGQGPSLKWDMNVFGEPND